MALLGKVARRVATAAVALGVVVSLGTGTAAADVFHGYWIYGNIHQEYDQAGQARGYPNGYGFFGNAITPESNTQNGGKFQKFSNNSSIYWHNVVSNGHANQIGGAIRDAWGRVGWETGYLGYPRTREFAVSGGRANHMVAGSIYWSSSTGAQNVWLGIRDHWAANGYETGKYGFPTQDTRTTNCSVWAQDFQGGTALYKQGGLSHTEFVGGETKVINYVGDTDSVQGNVLTYENQPGFLYPSAMSQTAADWNALNTINIVPKLPLIEPGIKVSSPNMGPDAEWVGLYSAYNAGPGHDTLEIDAYWAQGKPSADITAVLNHELG